MDDSTKETLLGQVRVLLGAGAGFLVGKGYISADVATAITGLVVGVLPMIWSWWSHRQTEAKIQVREAVAINAGVAVANAGEVGQTVRPEDVKQIIRDFSPVSAPKDK